MSQDDIPTPDRRSILKTTALGAFLGSSGLASASTDREPDSPRTELLVGVSAAARDPERTVERALSDGTVVHSNEALGYVTVTLPERTPERAKRRIQESLDRIDEIEYAEENATIETLSPPNDPHYGSQHAPQQVGCEGAWEETLGDDDVVISIVDQAVEHDHENLAANADDRVGEVFVGNMRRPYPASSRENHGTLVAGIANGVTDNGTGHAGISNCSFLSARALDETGRGSLADIADAIQWSTDQGVDVINLSLGSSSDWHTLENACEYAVSRGCLLVAGAGNNGGRVLYPAAYDSVIAVSALDSNGRFASYSNRGSAIELAAPGSRVLSTDLNDRYSRASGTSMATPVVSGVAGLVLSAYPDLSVSQLRDHLRRTATDVGLSSSRQGHGRIDANAAVNTVPEGYERDDEDESSDEGETDGDDEPGDEDESDGDEGETDDGDDEESAGRLLAFITEPDARSAGYEFTAEGPVEFAEAPYESPSGRHIEGGTYVAEDFIEEEDGVWHAGGVTGGGFGDAFRVDGPVTSVDVEQPEGMWIELDGEERSPEEVIEETGGNDDDDGDDGDDGDDDNDREDGDDGDDDNDREDGDDGDDDNDREDGDDGDDDNDREDGDDEDESESHCGAETRTARAEGSLRRLWWVDRDAWRYDLRTASPCSGTVTLEGPRDADFDLYVTTDGSQPSRTSYDESSTGSGADEAVTVDLEGDDPIRILVRAVDGGGEYTLTIEERGQ
ncbi:S8 family serine peptidase [Natrarchaeobius sp. A-rgal3]|uniref:S8 family peptidase n=1 Tax=Natrarchaeobius versutus TaxID=1679078 RepID=UPI00350F37A0